MNGVRGKLAKGTAWITLAGVGANALGLISTLVLARLLAPADFGLVALATTIMTIITSVTDLSLNSALVQQREPTEDHFRTAWTLSFARNAVLALVLCAAAFPAAAFYHSPRLAPIMFAFAFGLLIAGANNPKAIMMTKSLVFWQQAMFQISQKLTTLIVAVVIAIMFRTYWALVWGSLAATLVNAILSYTVLPMWPRFSVKHARDLFGFSAWLSLGQVINTINYNFDQLLIGGILGRAPLGYYTVGNNIAIMPSREATAPITNTLFPAFSNLIDEPKRLAAAYQSAQALVTSIALPAGVGMALVAGPLVELVMGAKWRPAIFLIRALASVFAFQTLGTLSQPLAMAAGETRLLFKRDLQNFLIRIPFIIVGIVTGGLAGIIYARVLTGSIAIVFHMQVVKRITGLALWTQLRANMRSLISVGVMSGVVALLGPQVAALGTNNVGLAMEVAALVTAGGVAYVATHVGLWLSFGRPNGPEREVLKIAAILSRKLHA